MEADQRLKDALSLIVKDLEDGAKPDAGRWYDSTAVHPHDWATGGSAEYFYRRDTILVRTEDVDLVVLALRADPDAHEAGSGPIIPESVEIELLPVIDGVTGLVWRYGRTERSAPDAKGVTNNGNGNGNGDGNGDGNADGSGSDSGSDSGNGNDSGGDSDGGQDDRPDDDDPLSTPRVLERLDKVIGVGKATPDHALWLCGNGHPCPATEPAAVPTKSSGPVPPVNSGICCGTRGWDGDGVMVGVVDGGLVKDAVTRWPWMAGVDGDPDLGALPNQDIQPYACHGTFVAGCVRCTAPKAEVYVKKAKDIDLKKHGGTAYEHEIIQRMSDLLDLGADIIVCEFDGVTRLHLPMHTFNAFYDRRLRHVNVVVVAPAGNDDSRLPTFPAAYSWVIGVGALSADGNSRAHFSNHGHWVDVYAPGEDLVNAFAVGDYQCVEEPKKKRHFEGLVNWSGTSFSTPLVAGMMAARMSATGENAPRAARALLRFARSQAAAGIGPVLYPDQVCGTCPPGPH
ncbi:S8/S53 family peptidase [Kribbella sp. NPDC051718]|uniref:S8/S53 family peptidase n=1 Tax=Kribbella sp. NPDC051718 TaxID=3155168 RepID=UPI003434ABE4